MNGLPFRVSPPEYKCLYVWMKLFSCRNQLCHIIIGFYRFSSQDCICCSYLLTWTMCLRTSFCIKSILTLSWCHKCSIQQRTRRADLEWLLHQKLTWSWTTCLWTNTGMLQSISSCKKTFIPSDWTRESNAEVRHCFHFRVITLFLYT